MKEFKYISSASFIKNVQPSLKKIAVFVLKHIWSITLLVGLVSKGIEIEHLGLLLPVYFYTDFFRDFLELLRSLFSTNQNPLSADYNLRFLAFNILTIKS